MTLLPTSRAGLDGYTCISEVSSYDAGKPFWTVLSLWYRDHADRPFVAVVEGRASIAQKEAGALDKFRAFECGTLSKAIEWLDGSELRDHLIAGVPDDHLERFPDANARRSRAAEKRRRERFYQGPDDLPSALVWLYGEDVTFGEAIQRFQDDFNGGGAVLVLERVLCNALRFMDRKAWETRA